ncbi:MAG: SDR family NAD(P)-dependent oxidoreductase [Patescibacteria group bacterium]|jgi:ubiquinone/menaquinone biosynthesis C-methylase UbiE
MSSQENATRDKFNALKKYYDETWDEDSHTLHVGLFQTGHDSLTDAYANATKHLIDRIIAISPIDNKSIILDVGCGTGRTLIEICEAFGCSGVGIDLSDAQILDAQTYLSDLNGARTAKGLSKIHARFVQGSASELDEVLNKDERFTHVISQDAIMLVANKQSLFENVYRFVAPGGVLAITDFLSEVQAINMPKSDQQLVYSLVNWTGELSEDAYLKILNTVGFVGVTVERHDADMIRTYQMLADKMQPYTNQDDTMYKDLQSRYRHIVDAVKRGKMGWGLFIAKKLVRKTALITGTKKHSIGRFIGQALHSAGWDVWLYSRSASKVDAQGWHERSCDISDENSIKSLLSEISNLDLVMMLADSGGHGELSELSEDRVKQFINAKLVGSVLLAKAIEKQYPLHTSPVQMVWCAGKPSNKTKDLILYTLVNAGLSSFIEAINTHHSPFLAAYYLPTGLISPSTLGDEYIHEAGAHLKVVAQHPETIVDVVLDIVDQKFAPGVIDRKEKIIL